MNDNEITKLLLWCRYTFHYLYESSKGTPAEYDKLEYAISRTADIYAKTGYLTEAGRIRIKTETEAIKTEYIERSWQK